METSDFDIQFFAESPENPDGGTGTDSVTQQAPHQRGSILSPDDGSVTQPADVAAQPVSQTAAAYQPFTLPEGMTADPEQMRAVSALFGEMNLTQEQAQKLVDFHAKHWLGAQAAYEDELNRRVAEWGEQTKAHPEFGGVRLTESLAGVRRAISKLGGEELEKALNETGAINHPGIFGAFARMGRLFAEDSFVAGQPAAGSVNSPSEMAARVYPAMKRG